MGTGYTDVDVKCPFFQSCGSVNKWSNITCEGIDFHEGTCLKIQFKRKKDMERYKDTVCSSDAYEKCLVNQMLEKKYQDKFAREKALRIKAGRHE